MVHLLVSKTKSLQINHETTTLTSQQGSPMLSQSVQNSLSSPKNTAGASDRSMEPKTNGQHRRGHRVLGKIKGENRPRKAEAQEFQGPSD